MGTDQTNDEHFNLETFKRLVEDMKSKRIPRSRMTMTRDSLMVLMRDTGEISFHAIYTVGNKRSSILLGEHPDMTLDRATKVAKSIYTLGQMGIDPQEGLHARLVREIESQGAKWRP